jgi:hypothetical protein
VVVAADPRQVAHQGALSLLCRGEGVEVYTCMDGGVGPHISTPPHRGGGEGDGRWEGIERPVPMRAGRTLIVCQPRCHLKKKIEVPAEYALLRSCCYLWSETISA